MKIVIVIIVLLMVYKVCFVDNFLVFELKILSRINVILVIYKIKMINNMFIYFDFFLWDIFLFLL